MTTYPSLALSIRQPWAWLILHASKDVENRSWPTKYRGPLLIHAGQTFYVKDIERDVVIGRGMIAESGISLPPPVTLTELKAQTGGIVGMVNVVDCVRDHSSPWATPGAWHWVLTDPVALPFMACKGRLGLFKVEDKPC